MPWTCKQCQAVVPLDDLSVCPACSASKAVWSMFGDRTRTFVVTSRQKLGVERGEVFPTERGSAPRHRFVSWRRSGRAGVLPAVEARALMDAGALPDAHDLFRVRITPPRSLQRWELGVAIKFAASRTRELAYDFEPRRDLLDESGSFSVHFLCVHGPGADSILFPRVQVLDVTEETALGHAPLLEVTGFRSKPVPVELGPEQRSPLVAARLPASFQLGGTFVKPPSNRTLRLVLDRMRDDPALRALVVGQAIDDPTDEARNRELARLRVEATIATLTGDLDHFLARFAMRPGTPGAWGVEELQWLLQSVFLRPGEPYYAGVVDGYDGRLTGEALAMLQVFHGLEVGFAADPATIRHLCRDYLATLGAARPQRDRFDVLAAGSALTLRDFGSGAPAVERYGHGHVDIFLYTPPLTPAAQGDPVDADYEAWCAASDETLQPPLALPMPLQVLDERYRPVAGFQLELFMHDPDEPAPVHAATLRTSKRGVALLESFPARFYVEFEHRGRARRVPFTLDPDHFGGLTIFLD